MVITGCVRKDVSTVTTTPTITASCSSVTRPSSDAVCASTLTGTTNKLQLQRTSNPFVKTFPTLSTKDIFPLSLEHKYFLLLCVNFVIFGLRTKSTGIQALRIPSLITISKLKETTRNDTRSSLRLAGLSPCLPDTLVVHATIVDLFPLLSNDDFDKLKGTRQGWESKAFSTFMSSRHLPFKIRRSCQDRSGRYRHGIRSYTHDSTGSFHLIYLIFKDSSKIVTLILKYYL